jgi:hypothetical protein
MKKMQISYYNSFEEADKASLEACLAMRPEERVEAVNIIRRRVFALKGIKADNKVKKVISYGKR